MSDVNEFDANTGEVIVRAYTKEELDQIKLIKERTIDDELILANTDAIRQSAIQKLKTLGLTENEAIAIVGAS